MQANPDVALKERAIPDQSTHQPVTGLVVDGLLYRNDDDGNQQYCAPKHLRLLA
jgi:hypothetical protein